MGNLTVNDRNQWERTTYSDVARPPSKAQRRVMLVYTVIGLAVLGVLTFAAVQLFDGWHHAIVIADLVIVFFGLAAWVWPERKRA